ncbi:MAG: hypothetical protein NTZ80_03745 [Patescibacteria group bacterium]|nr:hypothetical protein [Patescibacteria group bacterium]
MALNVIGSSLNIATPIYDPIQLINMGVALALILAGFLSLVYVLIGGFKFIISGGDESKTQEAMNTIRYALIGLVVTIFAFMIVTIVGRFFGFDLVGYINFDMMSKIIKGITSGGGNVITLN